MRSSLHRYSADTKLAKLVACVDQRIAIRHGQNAVDLNMVVKQIDDIAQLLLCVGVVRPDRLERDEVDDRGELVLDAAISSSSRVFLQGRRLRDGSGDIRLLIDSKLYRIVYFTCALIGIVSSRHCQRASTLAAS